MSFCKSTIYSKNKNIPRTESKIDAVRIFLKYICQGCIYCHPAYLTYMRSTSYKMPLWMKHKLESRLLGEISITSDMQMCRWHHLYGRKQRGTKESLDEGERGEWKSGLKLNIQKKKIMASGPITSWQTDGNTVETVKDFIFLNSRINEVIE